MNKSMVLRSVRQTSRRYPYATTMTRSRRDAAVVRLAMNETPLPPSPRVLDSIYKAARESNFYPNNVHIELRNRLAEEAGLSAEEVLITAGSAMFLGIVAQALLKPGDYAITSSKSYPLYRTVTELADAKLLEAPIAGDTIDLDGLLCLLTPRTRVIFIANPNNPTGTILEPAAITHFLTQVPKNVTVVLDEAYSDFATHFARERGVEYSRSCDYVRQGLNVLVLRTFSKAFGLAGLRIGYGFASATLQQHFSRFLIPYSVTNLAASAALTALDDVTHTQAVLNNNSNGATWLIKGVRNLGQDVTPTWANFIYLETNPDADVLATELQKLGVSVRALTDWGAPNAIRVSIGTLHQNQQFLSAFRTICARS